MTIGGAIAELQNLLNADDVPFYYKGGIEKVIETIQMEMADRKTEPTISKMEQVDKDINVRCKDEPQNGYVLSKDSDAYKFNKRMEVEEGWLNEQSGKE